MSPRFQRLVTILVSFLLLTGAITLILYNSKKNIVFFFTPSEMLLEKIENNQKIRIGGIVKEQSIKNINNDTLIEFIVTDNKKEISVLYDGIVPDLFRENQGVVVEGVLINKTKLRANRVFAKHDENYMPANIKKQIEENSYWKKNYYQQSVPKFETNDLFDENKIIKNKNIDQRVSLINFFASWCIPCKKEHPLLIDLKQNFPNLVMIGFNHKDKKIDAINFLKNKGNPYNFVGVDKNGEIGLEFGVFGLPETYLVDKDGNIIFKHAGPLTKKIIKDQIIPNI